MSQRLTVVLDDDALYGRLKLRALADGTSAKAVIEQSLREYLDGGRPTKAWDWDDYDEWQDEVQAINDTLPGTLTDYSNVKKHLYGGEFARPALKLLAEEPATYGAH